MRIFLTLLFVVTLILSFRSAAYAMMPYSSDSSLRCNNGLVTLGESKLDVFSKCGTPSNEADVGKVFNGYSTDYQQDWTYNMGSTSYLYTLKFAGNHLMQISRGSRGFPR